MFREVYRQLESSDLVIDAYNDDDDVVGGGVGVGVGVGGSNEVEESKPLRWRTRITISILSSILTLSYVVSGALRVLGKLFVVWCDVVGGGMFCFCVLGGDEHSLLPFICTYSLANTHHITLYIYSLLSPLSLLDSLYSLFVLCSTTLSETKCTHR